MTFSEYAGTSIVPTLSRLVLALVFITAGYNKVFRTADFNAEQATILKNMGVTVTPAPAVTMAVPANPAVPGDVSIVPVSYRPPQDQPTTAATTRPVVTNTLAPGMYRAPAMYQIGLMIHNQKWPIQPVHEKWLTWAAAYTELIGGVMMFVGLLSRLWGLGLSAVMCVAFYMTSLQPPMEVHKHITDFFTWAMDPMHSTTLFMQLSMFVLAFGIVLTGAGPLSIDRMFFGGPRKPVNPPPPPPDRPNRLEPIGSMKR
jgi:uncharacterized membrane protein YphA (DoxX/SURF4 family)